MEKRASIILVTGIVFGLMLIMGTLLAYQRYPKDQSLSVNTAQDIPSPIVQSSTTEVDGNRYSDNTYGFSFLFPQSWARFSIAKKALPNNSVELEVLLPLQSNEIAQWLEEPYKSGRNFRVWSLFVKEIETWDSESNECEGANEPCFTPTEIGRNNKYVIGSGSYYMAGGWDPCSDESAKLSEPVFCGIYSDILNLNQKDSITLQEVP